MKKICCWLIVFVCPFIAYCQPATGDNINFSITILTEQSQPAEGATVELANNNKLIKAAITNNNGTAIFQVTEQGSYTFTVSYSGYQSQTTGPLLMSSSSNELSITLQPAGTTLKEVSISSKKPFIQHTQGKTILNVDAAITNVGTNVLEVLEKSPGVTVDRNGGISLQGKAGVLVLIDDKQTYLSGADLNNLLISMNSSQVELIELMTNPPAKYDASGNAGIINIKTKKSKIKGFNGTVNIAAGQGKYPKNSGSLVMNYRTGQFNLFLTYSVNRFKYYTDLYALRKYYDDNDELVSVLEQPTYFSGTVLNNSLKTGVDYYLNPKTTIGIVLGGIGNQREGGNDASATWLNAAGMVDSTVSTISTSDNSFTNSSVNLNLRHTINATQEIAVDLDWLHYNIRNEQHFNNELIVPGGYTETAKGNITSGISIFTGKADHTLHIGKNTNLQSGWKSSYIKTDNITAYQYLAGGNWQDDEGRSNHFFYQENIHALYSSVETKHRQINLQAGLRFEYTGYNAHQTGNTLQKDSSFSRNYGALFSSGTISYEADSSNTFSFSFGRRIDRPAFQSLNPFFTIINKYTFETGNPYFRPQFSWNIELGHQYKELLNTTVSYSIIKDYFSQLFLTDSVTGILLYSQGNVGNAYNLGLSSTLTVSPFSWWTLNLQANFNYKLMKGFNGTLHYNTDINQLNLNCSNQFNFGKVYTGELSGFYTTHARNDLQELLYPTGQLSCGVSRPILKKKGTLKLSARDIFYTNAMEGLTQFAHATEYFILRRDSRVLNLSFTYRFGKAYKTSKRSDGSAGEEMERVGSGG